MIEIENLIKTYRTGQDVINAVDGVNMNIEAGDFASIMGHSGSGKTTLLSLIGGLTKPDSGKVQVGKSDIWSISDDSLSALRNDRIGFIYQFSSLMSTLTVIENILLPTVFSRERKEDKLNYAKELLQMFGIADKEKAYPSELSGGQQRRVAIARAFVNRPKLILADEPTGDLDEETESEVMRLFQQMNKEEGTTLVIVTHSSDIAGLVGKQYRMTSGRLEDVK